MEEVALLESPVKPVCRYCGAFVVVRFGLTPNRKRQRYLCRNCYKTFTDNGAAPGMRYPSLVIASALNQFYEAASLHWVCRHLMLQYGMQPDHANIRRWISRYTRQAVIALSGARAQVGKIWAASETRIMTRASMSRAVWLWDIVDIETRFLLATGFSMKKSVLDFGVLLDLATRRTNTWPDVILTDELIPQIGATQGQLVAGREGMAASSFTVRVSTGQARRILGVLRDRSQILQRLGNRNTAHLAVSGWAVHYNFFRPHPRLGGKTPAEAAGIQSPLKSWEDVVKM